ncbi:ATP-dependent DNA ligase [Paenibacillus humicus]|uniref:ATP-dependent DNA ligase n=1 Tax=Paenibacillus humicus TaxID=412861 RepID=UPI001FE45B72|nr:RNA ligase family protein [Paenibacillus humicus]
MKAPQAMLLSKREDPWDDDRYLFEPKIDGHRLLLTLSSGAVRLHTRHGNDVTDRYPELHSVSVSVDDIVLDGEVAYLNPVTGQIEFETIMERFRLTRPERIQESMARLPVHFYVFDILRFNGKDVRSRPLLERKQMLDQVLTNTPFFSKVMSVDGRGTDLFRHVEAMKLEGIVGKLKSSRYVGERSKDWIKVINYEYAEVAITGYRRDEFGWLVSHEGRPVGVVELAVPAAHRKAFYRIAQQLVTGERKGIVYLEPRIKARVRFRNWYKSGMLRSPEFVSFVI